MRHKLFYLEASEASVVAWLTREAPHIDRTVTIEGDALTVIITTSYRIDDNDQIIVIEETGAVSGRFNMPDNYEHTFVLKSHDDAIEVRTWVAREVNILASSVTGCTVKFCTRGPVNTRKVFDHCGTRLMERKTNVATYIEE